MWRGEGGDRSGPLHVWGPTGFPEADTNLPTGPQRQTYPFKITSHVNNVLQLCLKYMGDYKFSGTTFPIMNAMQVISLKRIIHTNSNIIYWALLLLYFLGTVYFKPFNLNTHYTCCCHKKGWANGKHAGTHVTEQFLVSTDSLIWLMMIKNVKVWFLLLFIRVSMFCELSAITGVDMKQQTTRRLLFHHGPHWSHEWCSEDVA